MISNAADRPLPSGTLPNMATTINDWFQSMMAVKIVKTLVNFQVVERGLPQSFRGVLQPSTGKSLDMKSEGQRQWDHASLHASVDLQLSLDDVLWIVNTRYRVMSLKDYSAYGYMEYELQEDFQDRSTAPPLPDADTYDYSVDLSFTSPLHLSVAPTVDATATVWRLYAVDKGNVEVLNCIQVIGPTDVKVTVPVAGNYRLVGVS